MDSYTEAHLFVAAIRLLHHKKNAPPLLEDVCDMIDISVEAGHALCRDLKKRGIIETLADPFSLKLTVANHLELEKIPRQEEKKTLAKELEEFQAKKKGESKKTSEIYAEIEKKKREMLSDIEAKFKKEMNKHQMD